MNRYLQKICQSNEELITSTPLVVFRILVSSLFLIELAYLFYFKELVFTLLPFVSPINPIYPLGILIATISTAALLVGYKTRISAAITFLFCLTILGQFKNFEYHVDYLFTLLFFLFIFFPVENGRRKIPRIYNNAIIFLGLGIVYFDSIFYKLTDPMWLRGLGMWIPASTPFSSHLPLAGLLEFPTLMQFLGYLTIAFELVFIFLFWFAKLRLPLLLIGLSLHLGILLCFPIPLFGLAAAAVYLLLFPLKTSSSRVTLEAPASKLPLFMGGYLLIQLLLIFTSQGPTLFPQQRTVADWIQAVGHRTLGIARHPVFVEKHFTQQQNVIRISFKEGETLRQLPVNDAQARPGPYGYGRFWVKWNWRTRTDKIYDQTTFTETLRWLLFWSKKNGYYVEGRTFNLEGKKMTYSRHWQPNRLHRLTKNPWHPIAKITIKDGKPLLNFQ